MQDNPDVRDFTRPFRPLSTKVAVPVSFCLPPLVFALVQEQTEFVLKFLQFFLITTRVSENELIA